MQTPQTDAKIVKLLDDPCTSFWLKDALMSGVNRDCVDVLRDAEILKSVLDDRYREIVSNTPRARLQAS